MELHGLTAPVVLAKKYHGNSCQNIVKLMTVVRDERMLFDDVISLEATIQSS